MAKRPRRQPADVRAPGDAQSRGGRVCATMQHHFNLAAADAAYRDNRRIIEVQTSAARLAARTTVLRIPVVVHVIYHDGQDNIGMEQINS